MEEQIQEQSFKAMYNETHGETFEAIPVLVIIKEDGFKVVPAEDRTNPQAQVIDLLWKDAGEIKFEELKSELYINDSFSAVIRFENPQDFDKIRAISQEFTPVAEPEPFLGIDRSFVARQSSYAVRKAARSLSTKIRDDSVDETDYLTFEVLLQKHSFFQGKIWVSHICELELVKSANLWQVIVQTKEGTGSQQNPEVAFLLQSVE